MPDSTGALVSIDRVHAARAVAAELGVDVLVLTPGSDLRYLCGYDAHAMERLTALVVPRKGEPFLVVPRLEAPMVDASPAGGLGLELFAWDETEDPFALVARRLPAGVARVAVDDQMHAAKVFAFRAALPGVEQSLAGAVIAPLRMR